MSPPAAPAQNPMQNVMRPMMASPPPMGAPLVPAQAGVMSPTSPPPRATTTSPGIASQSQSKPAASFDDLWSMSLGSASKPAGGAGTPQQKSMKDLEKEKVQAQIWGGNRPPAGAGSGFGSFSGAPAASSAAPPSSSGNGLDDLLF